MLGALQFATAATTWLVAGTAGFVAVLVFAANPRRNWNQWLAFFLVLVSGNFAAQALQSSANWPVEAVRTLYSVGFVFLVLDPFALAYFASVFPRREGFADRPWTVAAVGALALAFLAYEVATRALSGPSPGFDPVRYAFFAYLGACYTYAAWKLLGKWLEEPSTVMADQLRVVVFGMLVVTLPRVALVANDLAITWSAPGREFELLSDLALRLAALSALYVLARRTVRRSKAPEPRRKEVETTLARAGAFFLLFAAFWTFDRTTQAVAVLGFGVPAPLFALASYASEALTFTFRWLVFSAAMVYGIVRYQILSVNLRATRLTAIGIGAALVFVVVGAGAEALGPWGAAGISAVAIAIVGVGLLRLRPQPSANFLHERGLEVYRAQLAAALSEGDLTEERRRDLERTRERLGLSAREHEVLLAIAQAEESRGRTSGGVLLGRYEILRRLGAGGYATVYLARDREGGRLVVLKRIRADAGGMRAAVSASMRELEVARRVSHPNLVSVHDVVRMDDGAVVVMEFVEGGSLRDLVERDGPLPPERASALLDQVLAALGALHEAGIAHGDLKPENVLVGADGCVKVTDFGTAHSVVPGRTLVAGSGGAAAAGTLLYMAPEQARGGEATPASDLWATAALAVELLTGKPLVDPTRGGPYDLLRIIAEGRAVPPRIPGFDGFLKSGLQTEPALRPPSAAHMREALPATGRLQRAASKWTEV